MEREYTCAKEHDFHLLFYKNLTETNTNVSKGNKIEVQATSASSISLIILKFGVWEKLIAIQRNLLCSIEEFEPYCAFHRIAKNKFIGAPELIAFLLDNGIQQPQEAVQRLIQFYSLYNEDRW